jgi:hypothetical protein
MMYRTNPFLLAGGGTADLAALGLIAARLFAGVLSVGTSSVFSPFEFSDSIAANFIISFACSERKFLRELEENRDKGKEKTNQMYARRSSIAV